MISSWFTSRHRLHIYSNHQEQITSESLVGIIREIIITVPEGKEIGAALTVVRLFL